MKHCPACFLNYHDKFEECFKCHGKLQAGEVPEGPAKAAASAPPAEGAVDEQVAGERLRYAKFAAVLLAVAFAAVLLYGWATDPTMEVYERYTLYHDDTVSHLLLTSGGVARSEVDRKVLLARTGLALPAVPEQQAIAYFPLSVTPGVPPSVDVQVRDARREGDGATVTLAQSVEKTESFSMACAAVTSAVAAAGAGGVPSMQLVVAARLPWFEGPVRFTAVGTVPGAAGPDLHQMTQHAAYEATVGWYRDFAWFAGLGFVGLLGFFWLVLKLS